ncbi:unnamed protein product [Ranitomeya imitator]|uniref:PIH1 domain-containing protein 1 n=1 Tax=Ranitomeya imitator TaxID=111125 RepID=A0ABN9KZQ0_9NEOB|nr:unnamed protein product [Ranitomeya imitator]
MKPCAFFSRKFSPAERNYDVGNRELLAMKWAFEEWRHWLEGAKHRVVVLTDHKNLTYLESAKRLNPRQARWSLFFSRFDFVVSYLPGSKNVKADALSRSFLLDSPGVPELAGQVESSDCPGVDTVVDRLQQIWTHVVDNLTLSQEKAQRFANRRRCVGPRLRVGDLVWLSSRYVPMKVSSPKFKPRFIGPYKISEVINPVSFRLALPASFAIHNVFHRSLLQRYVAPVVPSVDPPAPVLVEGELEYVVEKILDSRVSRRKLQYLVKWKGYGQEDNSWVFASDVHAADLAKQEIQSRMPNLPETRQIRPQPGFCIKTRTSKNAKIFINICKSSQIPAPPELTEPELVSILESDDPSGYRVPMSLGEPHVEVDNSGGGCTAYDIVINGAFFEKIKNNELFREFFVTVAMEGLENKYEMELSREWKMLKNRKFLGSIFDQNIRTKSKPMIQEMDTGPSQLTPSKSLISEVESSPVKPDYTIMAEPPEGHPSFLVAEISLPKVFSTRSLVLDLGEDRIVLVGRPDLYHLDVFIPYNINQEQSGAQFNKDSKDGNQGKHRVTKRGPALSYPMFTLVTGIVGRWRAKETMWQKTLYNEKRRPDPEEDCGEGPIPDLGEPEEAVD